jgi:hypothetical protein
MPWRAPPVEPAEEAVAGGVDLVAPEARQLATHSLVVLEEQVAPRLVAELRGARRGADEIGKEHRSEHRVRKDDGRLATKELEMARGNGWISTSRSTRSG